MKTYDEHQQFVGDIVLSSVKPLGVCARCGKPVSLGRDGCCNNGHEICFGCWEKAGHNCPVCSARYPAPAPAPKVTDAPKHKDATDEQTTAWRSVFDLCVELGMEFDEPTGEQDVIAFIRSLAQRAGEGFTVEEIADAVVKHCHPCFCTTSEIADFIREWKGEK